MFFKKNRKAIAQQPAPNRQLDRTIEALVDISGDPRLREMYSLQNGFKIFWIMVFALDGTWNGTSGRFKTSNFDPARTKNSICDFSKTAR